MYSIILAGGGGTRLWPLSSPECPKPFVPLINGKSLLEKTYDRLLKFTPPDRIIISVTQELCPLVQKFLPQLSVHQIIIEPTSRNTAPCIALAAWKLAHQDPEAALGFFPADHLFEDEDYFSSVAQAAFKTVIQEDKILVLGIQPHEPSNTYGHLVPQKNAVKTIDTFEVLTGDSFIEKPPLEKSAQLIQKERALFNGGMYFGKASVFMQAYQKYAPDIARNISKCLESEAACQKYYALCDQISIDYAITEKVDSYLIIPTHLDRIDIGNFISLKDIWKKQFKGNFTQGEVYPIESSENIVYAKSKPIVLLGMQETLVVDTDEVLYICPKDKALDVQIARDIYLKKKEQL